MEGNRDLLQEYAVTHCGGDRKKAIYRLMTEDAAAATPELMAGMQPADAEFALLGYELLGMRNYGNKENYKKIAQIEDLQRKLGAENMDPTTTPNPFGKMIWEDVLKVLSAILLPLILMLLLPSVAEAMTVLLVMTCAVAAYCLMRTLLQHFRFKELVKLWAVRPPAAKVEHPSFDQCMTFINANQWRSVFWQDVLQAVKVQKKANLLELAFFPAYFVAMVLVLALGAEFGVFGLVLAGLVLAALAFWRCAKVLGAGEPVRRLMACIPNIGNKQELKNKVMPVRLGMVLLICVYIFLAAVGVLSALTL